MSGGSAVSISYEDLVETYHRNLTAVLRGFRSLVQYEFLDTWVPDDDPVRSILNLAEAAAEADVPAVAVQVGRKTLATLDVARLTAELSAIAQTSLRQTEDGLEVSIRFDAAGSGVNSQIGAALPERATLDRAEPQARSSCAATAKHESGRSSAGPITEIHPTYRSKLERFLDRREHHRVLEPPQGQILARATEAGATLMAVIDPGTHAIRAASYQSAPSEVHRGLLEGLCEISVGLPIQEASEHAVIKLENRLRDHAQTAAVPGIVSQENPDGAFAFPLALVRGLYADYRRQTGYEESRNFYDEPCTPAWESLSLSERMARLQKGLAAHPAGEGIEVVRVEGHQRVVLRVQTPSERDSIPERLRALERHLKATVEPKVYVELEPKKDLNKLRDIRGIEV